MIKCPNCNHPLTEFIEGSSMGVNAHIVITKL